MKTNSVHIKGVDVVTPLTILYEGIWLSKLLQDTILVNRLLQYDSNFRDIQFWNNKDLKNDLKKIRPQLDTFVIARNNKTLDLLVKKLYRAIEQSIVFLSSRTLYTSNRDSLMAVNTIHISENELKGIKHIIWSHNGHICKKSRYKSSNMGEYLKSYFGEDYYTVGFYFVRGKALGFGDLGYGIYSLEALNNRTEKKLTHHGFNKIISTQSIRPKIRLTDYGVSLNKPISKLYKIADFYDAIFVLKEVHPPIPLNTQYNSPNCYITIVTSSYKKIRFDSVGIAISAIAFDSIKPFEYGIWIGELSKAKGGKSIYKTDSFDYKERASGFGFEAARLKKIKDFNVQLVYKDSFQLYLNYVAIGFYKDKKHLVTYSIQFNNMNDLEKVKLFKFKGNIITDGNEKYLSIQP